MNKLIKQLADQAGRKECALGYGMPENVLWGDRRIEDFAVFIVTECGKFTDPVTRNLMMKHFGIEE